MIFRFKSIHYSTLKQLRNYQEECINSTLSKLQNGVMRQAVSLPVGAGKTVHAIHYIYQSMN